MRRVERSATTVAVDESLVEESGGEPELDRGVVRDDRVTVDGADDNHDPVSAERIDARVEVQETLVRRARRDSSSHAYRHTFCRRHRR